MFNIKNIPFITITISIATLLLTIKGFSSDHASAYNDTNINDVLAVFSHADWGHYFINMIPFFLVGSAAEIMASGRRWMYYIPTILSISIVIIHGEIANMNTIGASGWCSAINYIALGIIAVYYYENRRYYCGDIARMVAVPIALFAFVTNIIDITLTVDNAYANLGGVNHATHIAGMVIGLTFVVCATAYVGIRWFNSAR